jgi:hypothetical protein
MYRKTKLEIVNQLLTEKKISKEEADVLLDIANKDSYIKEPKVKKPFNIKEVIVGC